MVSYNFKFLIFLIVIQSLHNVSIAQTNTKGSFKRINGITLSMHSFDYDSYSYLNSLQEIKATGAPLK